MSDAESLMWRMEQDPYLSSNFAAITILDRPPSLDVLRARLEHAGTVVPRLRQRVHSASGNLSTPAWVDDPNYDIDYHLRHIALPKPGTMRTLLDTVALLTADPLDRTRPQWQFWVVDGLRGGKSALLTRMHHTMADGEASLALSLQYLDFERNAPPRKPVSNEIAEPVDNVAPVDTSHMFRDLTIAGLRLPLGVLKQIRELVTEPASIPSAAGQVRELLAQLRNPPASRSTLWADRSLRRQIETLHIPLEGTKSAAKRLGGTVNVAFLTAAAQASGEYHRRLGEPVDELHASMAMSTRTSESGSNAFSVARLAVPTGEMTVAERFATIADAARVARSSLPGLDSLAAMVAAVPSSVLAQVARQQSRSVDFATSNVRASAITLYLAGAQVLATYPVGPLLGVAFNATMISYVGEIHLGINCDRAAITDTALLRECFADAFKDLRAAR